MSVLERRLPPRRTAANCGCWRRARSSIWKISQKRANAFLRWRMKAREDAEEMRLAAALSAYHAKDWVTADREFSEALEADRGDPAAVRYYLGHFGKPALGRGC